MSAPDVAQVVREADHRILHQVMRAVGTDEAVGLLRFASPAQITRIVDLDLWTPRPGQTDRFDPERFGEWVEALVEEDIALALAILRELGVAFTTTAISQHIAVCSRSTAEQRGLVDSAVTHEIGALVLVARRPDAFHAIVAVLDHAHAEDGAFFHDLMAECRQLSYEHLEEESGFDVLLTRRDQAMADLAFERQRRMEADGYLTRDQAVAFLAQARQPADTLRTGPDPIAHAYFRDRRVAGWDDGEAGAATTTDEPEERVSARRFLIDLLADQWQGGAPGEPLALLGPGTDGATASYARLAAHIRKSAASDPAAGRVVEQLAFLAGVLLEGGQVHDRAFTVAESSDAAAALCNLGLEVLALHPPRTVPNRRGSPSVEDAALIRAFTVGWRTIHESLCAGALQALLQVLSNVSGEANDQIADLRLLRRALLGAADRGEPWQARPALDTIAVLDAEAWVNLQHFINPCPVVPRDCVRPSGRRAARLRVHPDQFEFVSGLAQVRWAEAYLARLPAHLGL